MDSSNALTARSSSSSYVLLDDDVFSPPGSLFGFPLSRFPSPRFSRSNSLGGSLNASFDGGYPMVVDPAPEDVHSLGAGQTLQAVADFLADDSSLKREPSLPTAVKQEPMEQPLPPVVPEVTNAIVTFNVGCALEIARVVSTVPGAFRGKAAKDRSAYLTNREPIKDRDEENQRRKIRRAVKGGKKKVKAAAPKEFADKGAYKAQIWPSGKILVYAKTVEAAVRSAHEVVSKLKAVDEAVALHDLKVINVVGEVACGFAIHLQALAHKYAHCTSFDPNARSPEVKFRLESGVKFRIFATGRISVQGAKTMESVHQSFAVLYGILKDFDVKKIVVN